MWTRTEAFDIENMTGFCPIFTLGCPKFPPKLAVDASEGIRSILWFIFHHTLSFQALSVKLNVFGKLLQNPLSKACFWRVSFKVLLLLNEVGPFM